jgi:hypothetical protein
VSIASVTVSRREILQPKMVKIYVMGREYLVPEGLTIHKALEYAGI